MSSLRREPYTFLSDDADVGWYGNSIGTWSLIFLPFRVSVGESLDSSIPHTLPLWLASALVLILSAPFLHSCEVEAASAMLEPVVSADPTASEVNIIAVVNKLVTNNLFNLVMCIMLLMYYNTSQM